MSHGSEHGSGKGFFGSMKEKFNKAKSAGKEWASTAIGGNPENVTMEEKKNKSKDYITTLGLGGEYDKEGKAVREKDETLKFRDSESIFSRVSGEIGEVKDWAKKKLQNKEGIRMDRMQSIGSELKKLDGDLGQVDDLDKTRSVLAGQQSESTIEPGDEWVNPYAENSDPGEDVEADQDPKPEASTEKAENLEIRNPALDRLAELIMRLSPLKEGNKQVAGMIEKQEWIHSPDALNKVLKAVEAVERLGLNKQDKELVSTAKDLIIQNTDFRQNLTNLISKFGVDVAMNQELITKVTTGAELSKNDLKSVLGVIKQMYGLYPMGEDTAKMEKVKKHIEKNIS